MVSIHNSNNVHPSQIKNILQQNPQSTTDLPIVSSDDFVPPVNRWISTSGFFLAGAMATTVMLASVIKYNVTVKASATVRPTGEVRLVQPEIEASVKSIEVKENQIVKQGDVIARLNDEQLQIKKSQLQGNIQQINLQIVQIDAQIKTLKTQLSAESRVNQRSVLSAQADLARNQKEYSERQATTNSELLSSEASLQKAKVDWQKAKADLAFANRDKLRYQSLVQVGAISKRDFDQKQVAAEQANSIVDAEAKTIEIAQAKVKAAKATLNPTQATITIAQQRIVQEQAKGEATIATLNKEQQGLLQRRSETQNQLQQTQKELQQIWRQLQSSVIRATSDGVILKLNLRNPNQVVRPSEAVAEIAPSNAPLVVKAMIPPGEIQKVGVGNKVQMRVEACSYPDYGTLNGIIKTISPDAITPSGAANTQNSYFEATIQPEKLTFGNSRRQCQLQSGMQAKADIISKEDTVLRFILRKARLLTDL
ncbi:hypothetical protein NIES4071_101420 (plasmid) [Calothrix sp. NIES-4071]|nr:hypothetical protein NIES4071_101420 [Calothrix sp. NIES-4071]BAZ64523.1 hypothetical protein NIES4105_102560 [Calothrix sp. NIES-4105]